LLLWHVERTVTISKADESGLQRTFKPMQRIVPTSDSARGDSRRAMVSVLPLGSPGLRTDDPVYVSTLTSFPARIAAPTSRSLSAGWPMRMEEEEFGMKRTRPGDVSTWQSRVGLTYA
jgi:hypothetical protein